MSFINDLIESPAMISFLTGASNYTWLTATNGKKELISKPLSFFESRLPRFIRIHKTALINPEYAVVWEAPPRAKMAGSVQMGCGTVLPVGRRRWPQIARLFPDTLQESTPSVDKKIDRSVVFVSDSQPKATWVRKTLKSQHADCLVSHVSQGKLLPSLLNQLSDDELPMLILLDASTSVQDRMKALQLLKHEPRMAAIPTLLLVAQNESEMVHQGYAGWANSVVTIPDDPSLFSQTIYRLSRFWFNQAALPTRNKG
ncbi:LytTR family transcriptional regulator DNA-binding domain-containing protein [Larkinella sp. VNQ87]|uniref:LytTR family transcriptional regulator DNA-binding domain-containing protein n=1 Tax=Larkinella sp. VNQ87 TaxID=3400921 RepID=UPI003C0AEFE9